MHHRVLASVSVAALVAAFVLLPAVPAAAQTDLRTGWGAPDLQGIWDFRTITPLERPEDLGDQAFLTAEEAANLEQEVIDRNTELARRSARRTTATESVDRGEEGAPGFYNNFWLDRGTRTVGTRRTSLIVDPPNGRLPEMSPEGRERTEARRAYLREHPADSWLDRSAFDRCILGFNAGPPITPGGYNQNLQVFQTSDEVVLVTEMVHTVRVVPLDGRPSLPGHVRQWSGDSRGHWEGDTLVIETTNFNDQRRWRGTTRNVTLVERLTRVDADTLDYTYTVTDPETWTSPWTASIPMRRSDEPLYEYACHEGNYSMPGILGGHRVEEAEAAAAAVAAQSNDWTRPFPGHRVIGNLYAVGTYGLAVFLVTSDEGHFLINTGLEDSIPLIRDNIESLGFRLEDVKVLLQMQAHWDHTAALAQIKEAVGAEMWATAEDAPVLEDGGFSDPHFGGRQSFRPVAVDRIIEDGEVLELGDARLTVMSSPGHTAGSSSYLMTVTEGGRDYSVAIANMNTINPGKQLVVDPTYPGVADDFAETFRRQKALDVDVWVSAHGGQYGLHDKYEPGQEYSPDTFVDPEGFREAVERLEGLYLAQLESERQ